MILKEAYQNLLVLCTFQVNELARIEIDTLDLVVGACLYQEKDGKWHLITYYSRKISVVE